MYAIRSYYDQINPNIKILGNGDVQSVADSLQKVANYGVDGVMIGRGIFTNPWLYNPGFEPSKNNRLDALLLHATLYQQTWEGEKPWSILKRFFKIYTNSFNGAPALRALLMDTHNLSEVIDVLELFKTQNHFSDDLPL